MILFYCLSRIKDLLKSKNSFGLSQRLACDYSNETHLGISCFRGSKTRDFALLKFGSGSGYFSLLFLIFNLLIVIGAKAQLGASAYSFQATSGTYNPITGATIVTSSSDDGSANGFSIGFNFVFDGVTYDQFNVSTNGWITLGTIANPNTITNTGLTNNFAAATLPNSPLIGPLWDDIEVTNRAANIVYALSGSAPNQVLTIQYDSMQWNYAASTASIAFQIKLYQTSNKIEFVYKQLSTTLNNASASIGIASVGGNYLCLNNSTAAPIASSTINTTTINTLPANGQVYAFLPPPQCTASLAPGNTLASATSVCAGNTVSLSLAVYSLGCTYLWQSSPSATGPWTNIAATSATYTATINTTLYYRCAVTCTANGQTVNSTPVQVIADNTCVVMPVSGTSTMCSGTFYDSGGPTAAYGNNENRTVTFYPSTPGALVKIEFTSFSTENNYDGLMIYDGNSTAAPLISSGLAAGFDPVTCPAGSWRGTGSPGTVISSAADGSLTFVFASDFIITSTGWVATVSCIPPCTGTPTPGNTISSAAFVCDGSQVNLSLQNLFAGVTYDWKSSSDNITYTSIGVSTSTCSPTIFAGSTWFKCDVTCTSTGQTGTSTPVLISSDVCTNIIMPGDSTLVSAVTCASRFYDNGGSRANYTNFAIGYVTLYPAIPGNKIRVTFNSFRTEANYDGMMIYNGNSTAAPLISSGLGVGTDPINCPAGSWRGTGSPGTVTSTAGDGSLTFAFRSDYIINYAGWDAFVTCYNPNLCTAPNPGSTRASSTTICYGGSTNLSLQNSPGGIGMTYQWKSSPDSLTWTNITGAVQSTYKASPFATTYYKCTVSCPSFTSSDSRGIKITVDSTCIEMPASATLPTCNSIFYDSGGQSSSYGNNENNTFTLNPGSANNAVSVAFTNFSLHPSDTLKIYNGVGTSSLLGSFVSSPGTVTSTDATGALTFKFISSSTDTSDGWVANVSCVPIVACTNPPAPGSTRATVDTLCSGGNTVLSLSNNALGTGSTFQWQSGPSSTGPWTNIAGATNATYQATPVSSIWFTCLVTCAGNAAQAATSAPLQIVIVTQPSITDTTNNFRCSSGSVTLGATASAGLIYWYSTSLAGSPLGSGGSFNTPSITTTTTYYVAASIGDCQSPRIPVVATIESNPTALAVTPTAATICADPAIKQIVVTGGLLPDGSEAPVFWSPATNLYSDAAATIPITSTTSIRTVYCKMPIALNNTSNVFTIRAGINCQVQATCTITVLDRTADVSIAITTPVGTICAGDTVTFVATPVNGGSGIYVPGYKWSVNGVVRSGPSGNTSFGTVKFPSTLAGGYNLPVLNNGDVVRCIMIVNPFYQICNPTNVDTSNAITLNINPSIKDSVQLVATSGSTICAGDTAVFTASPTLNTWTTPLFEFFVGAVSQGAPSVNNVFKSTTLTTGQQVSVRMTTASSICPRPTAATTLPITVTVNQKNTPIFDIGGQGYFQSAPRDTLELCLGATAPSLPTTSTNSYAGTWSPSVINTGSTGTTQYIFTPTASTVTCPRKDTLVVNINSSVTPTFASPFNADTVFVCQGSTPLSLPASANAGVTGTWSPTTISTTNPGKTGYTFTPNIAGCYVNVIKYVRVYDKPVSNSISLVGVACPTVPAQLNTAATAGGTLSYIWQSGTTATGPWTTIAGATSASYYTSTSTYYRVIAASNGCSDSSASYQLAIGSSAMSGTYTIGAITATGASSSGNTITVSSTAGLSIGMPVAKTAGTGTLAGNTVITSIVNGTQITVNNNPTLALSAASLGFATCTNYVSFAAAISDLNSRGISGNCTFNVSSGLVEFITARLDLGNGTLNAQLATRSIVFQKSGGGANPLIRTGFAGANTAASTALDGMWALSGADNITIDGIDLTDTNTVSATTMMEYGFGLLKLSGTDGSQNNTIKNCVVTLNKNNVSAGIANTTFEGSVGILACNITSGSTAGLTVSAYSGTNSLNKFYSNTVQNCNTGIGLYGNAIAWAAGTQTKADSLNDVGGATAATGNTIRNFGGGVGSAVVASGVRATQQFGINISNNTINNNNGGTPNPSTARLVGIFGESGNYALNTVIKKNSITLNHGSATLGVSGIENKIGNTINSNTVVIDSNSVTGTTVSTTGYFYGISNNAAVADLSMNGNSVSNVNFVGSSGEFRGIYNAEVCTKFSMNNNTLTGNTINNPGFVTSVVSYGICSFGSSATTLGNCFFNNNVVTNNVKSLSGTTAVAFHWLSLGAVTSVSGPTNVGAATTVAVANNNVISDNIITYTGNVSGTCEISCLNIGTSSITVNNNIIQRNGVNVNSTSSTTFNLFGIRSNNSLTSATFSSNTIRRLFVSTTNTSTSSGTHDVRGIYSLPGASAALAISNNSIDSLYSDSTFNALITGIRSNSGAGVTISKNRIHTLLPGYYTAGFSLASGIRVLSGTAVGVYNNMISLNMASGIPSLRAAANGVNSTDAARGIDVSSSTASATVKVYHNSIRIAGSGKLNFGSSGIYHTGQLTSTTGAIDLRNNLVFNNSTPLGSGIVAALKRSASGALYLVNYSVNSNNNSYYVQSVANAHTYYEGSTAYTTLANFQALGRDSNSITALPTFLYPSDPVDLHIDPAGNNCSFEGGGKYVAEVPDDVDADTRFNPTPDIGADEFTATAGGNGVWKGYNTNWNDPANWCGVVPTSTTDVVIPSGKAFYPIITTTNAVTRNITISPQASVTINTTGALSTAGNWSVDGTLTNNGTIRLNGSTVQTFPGGTSGVINPINVLDLNNAAGVGINKPITIKGTLMPQAGTITVTSPITLKSTIDSTASVSALGVNVQFLYGGTGEFVVERYIPQGRKWRFLSAPVNSSITIKNGWQEGAGVALANPNPTFGTIITDNNSTWSSNGFDAQSPGGPSMKYYDTATQKYVGVTSTSNQVKNTAGYMLFVRGDRSCTPANATLAPTTLRLRGPIYEGNYPSAGPIIVTRTTAGDTNWVSVGNPYPSSVNFGSLQRSNIYDGYYGWDPKIGGSYGVGGFQFCFNDGSGNYIGVPGGATTSYSSSQNNSIQSGQAFFVYAPTAANGSLRFVEAAKVSGSRNAFRPPTTFVNQFIHSRLNSVNTDGTLNVLDGFRIVFDNQFSNAVDQYDAFKMLNAGENFSIINNKTLLIVEKRKPVTQQDTLYIDLKRARGSVNYRIEMICSNLDRGIMDAWLVDRYSGIFTPLNMNGEVTYDFTANTSVPASVAGNRFYILFKKSTRPRALPLLALNATRLENGGVELDWSVKQSPGMKSFSILHSPDGQTFEELHNWVPDNSDAFSSEFSWVHNAAPEGNHFYKIVGAAQSGDEGVSNLFRLSALVASSGGFSVSPNPFSGDHLSVRNEILEAGSYLLKMINPEGKIVYQRRIVHPGGALNYKVSSLSSLPEGTYRLEVSSNREDINKKNIISLIKVH